MSEMQAKIEGIKDQVLEIHKSFAKQFARLHEKINELEKLGLVASHERDSLQGKITALGRQIDDSIENNKLRVTKAKIEHDTEIKKVEKEIVEVKLTNFQLISQIVTNPIVLFFVVTLLLILANADLSGKTTLFHRIFDWGQSATGNYRTIEPQSAPEIEEP